MISYSQKAKAHIAAIQKIKEEKAAANTNTNTNINTTYDFKSTLHQLQRSFPGILREQKNGCKRGEVITYRCANPSGNFLDHSKAKTGVIGILFHGSSKKSISSICRQGMHDNAYFTSSLDYAISRSKFKELRKEYNGSKVVEVLAMAVIVDDVKKLNLKEVKLKSREYSLPLFIITVQLSPYK